MIELANITEALKLLEGFSPLQRVLLTCTGTLQGTLSAYFGEPVEVQVINQLTLRLGRYSRRVRLFTPSNNHSVCYAYSSIITTSPEVIDLIETQKLGLGQILAQLGLKPTFTLKKVSQNEAEFSRDYELASSVDGQPIVNYQINEVFPKGLYK